MPITAPLATSVTASSGIKWADGERRRWQASANLSALRSDVRSGDSRRRRQGDQDPWQSRRCVEPRTPLPERRVTRRSAPRPGPHPQPADQGRRRLAGSQLGRGVSALHRIADAGDRQVRNRCGHRLHRQSVGALVFTGPLCRRPDGHVRDAGHVFAGDGRPMAEEPVVASDVRPVVELPSARPRRRVPCWPHPM
jgi:hypothetical protein